MIREKSVRLVNGDGRLRAFYLALAVFAAFLAVIHAFESGKVFDAGAATGASTSFLAEESDVAQERSPDQRAVADFIARRYRIADQPGARYVLAAYNAGKKLKVDPLLILGVIAIESRFNPVAQSEFGAQGLMQVIPKYHQDKLRAFGGQSVLLDPEVNIFVGTSVLREYMRKFGEIETALQMYAGAFDEPTSFYANKVLAERSRLEQVLQRARREAKSQTVPAPQTSAAAKPA